jgi:hypothetical protein
MKNKNYFTDIDVAKFIDVDKQYLNVLLEQELKKLTLENEMKKTEDDFFGSDFVDFPK